MTDTRHKTGSQTTDWERVHARLAATQRALEEGAASNPQTLKAVLKQRARDLAENQPETRPGAHIEGRLEVVTFLLAAEQYGIETSYVNEVYALKDLTPLPCTPAFVL